MRLSSVDASRPTWFERLERGASRFNTDTATIPIFGVIVALTVIIYLLASGIEHQGRLEPLGSATEDVGEAISRVVAGRTFDLVGEAWQERGLEPGRELDRLDPQDPELKEWIELHPDFLELASGGRSVRMELDGRQVEVRFANPD